MFFSDFKDPLFWTITTLDLQNLLFFKKISKNQAVVNKPLHDVKKNVRNTPKTLPKQPQGRLRRLKMGQRRL